MSRDIADEKHAGERVEESTSEHTVESVADGERRGRIEREETHEVSGRTIPRVRRNQVIVVGAVALLALVLLTYALFFRGPAKEDIAEAPAPSSPTGTVTFLMEQQWLIRMKLALVE